MTTKSKKLEQYRKLTSKSDFSKFSPGELVLICRAFNYILDVETSDWIGISLYDYSTLDSLIEKLNKIKAENSGLDCRVSTSDDSESDHILYVDVISPIPTEKLIETTISVIKKVEQEERLKEEKRQKTLAMKEQEEQKLYLALKEKFEKK